MTLIEVPFTPVSVVVPPRGQRLIRVGLERSRAIHCFDFVPSNYEVFYRTLAALATGRFCEWGSGMGIATGLAELLGFQAHGIEIDPALAAASRQLLADCGLQATIETGDFLVCDYQADVYFAYCWFGDMESVRQRFDAIAPANAVLLLSHGAEDIRYLTRAPGGCRSPVDSRV